MSLPREVEREAMDALTWSYGGKPASPAGRPSTLSHSSAHAACARADSLLSSDVSGPTGPFSAQECKALLEHLQSLDDSSPNHGVARKRVLYRMLLRISESLRHYR